MPPPSSPRPGRWWLPNTTRDSARYKRAGPFSASSHGRVEDRAALRRLLESDSQPAYSPNGTKISFMRSRSGQFKIFTMDCYGSGQKRLTAGTSFDASPD
ncbi:MAG: PD40 domain-containing protein [Rubrobacteraceae bacterium]|nr:PD40 domain-containing protein [Rubrobacteraceae bacterium]